MLFFLAIFNQASVITFDKLEKRSQSELKKLFDAAIPSWSYPYVENQVISKNKCNTASLGTMTSGHIRDGINRLNFYRYLVGLDDYEVYHDYSRQQSVMECSRVLDLCNKISHTPKADGCTACMTNDADKACSQSNLFSIVSDYVGISYGIDEFIQDFGSSNAAVGHRRWLLYPTLGNVSFGKANKYGAIRVFGIPEHTNTSNKKIPFVAFPSPGYFPNSFIYERWSFSIPQDGLMNAKSVSHKITADGTKISASGKLFQNTLYSKMADSTYVMSLSTANNKKCQGAKSIVVQITVDGQVYKYTIKPFNVSTNIYCLCGRCDVTEMCYSICPRGYSVMQLLIKDMFTGETIRQQIHDAVVQADKEGRNMQFFSIGQEARNYNPTRIELDDMTRVNISFIGAPNSDATGAKTKLQYLTLYPTQRTHADPKKSQRKTTTYLNNIVLSDGQHLGGRFVSFPVSFHNLQVNWLAAKNLPSLKVDSLTLVGGNLVTKVVFLAGNKVQVLSKNGENVTMNGKVIVKTDKNSLLATNAVPLSLETENTDLEVQVTKGVTEVPSMNIKFTLDSNSKKTLKATGDWSQVSNSDSVTVAAKSGSISLISSGTAPNFDISSPNTDPETDSSDSSKKKEGGLGGGAVAGIVIAVIVVVAAVAVGILMFLGFIPKPKFSRKVINGSLKNGSNEESHMSDD